MARGDFSLTNIGFSTNGIQMPQPSTLSFWFYDTLANGTIKWVAGDGTSASIQNGHGIDVTAGSVRFTTNGSTGRVTSTNTYSANTWNHVVGISRTNTSRSVFLNGVRNNSAVNATPSATTTFRIGSRTNTGGSGPQAPAIGIYVAEVAVWAGVQLSDEEVNSLYKGAHPLTVRPESLTMYTPLVRDPIDILGDTTFTTTGSIGVLPHPLIYK